MIGYLKGTVVEKSENNIVVNTGQVGYEVLVAQPIALNLEIGQQAEIFVHTHYKTDGISLYGFSCPEEKLLFLQLIKVDTVGPKSALNILQSGSWQTIVDLIEEGDVGSLSKFQKVGKKTAEHLVVKLKGKLRKLFTETGFKTPAPVGAPKNRMEVESMLVNLGFRPQEVGKVLEELPMKLWEESSETIIRSALNLLGGN